MIQPGLCAHTVITLSEGPASVADFEAKSSVDALRQKQVLNYYSPGIRKKKQNSWLDKGVLTLLWLIIYGRLGALKLNLGNICELDGKLRTRWSASN